MKISGNLADGVGAAAQQAENFPPRRIGNRLEYPVLSFALNRNHMVTIIVTERLLPGKREIYRLSQRQRGKIFWMRLRSWKLVRMQEQSPRSSRSFTAVAHLPSRALHPLYLRL